MPVTKSAKKALRQTKRRTLRNLKRKQAYQRELKRVKRLLAMQHIAAAEKLVAEAYRALDKAAKTGVLHRNAAARRKARLMRWIRNAHAAV